MDIRQSAIDPQLSYQYGEGSKVRIPVMSKRSYSHRIKVHKRRSIKPQLVKDELNFQSERVKQYRQRIQKLMEPRPLKITTNVKKVIALLRKVSKGKRG